ncbi:VOC family protein [uncultured Selenomonas sp.]|uniref:VOC family protein n=1 Tax=uncultured Selenomonas sp. TaxID=159275 RepID=UPI0025FC538C|nr:VOC family protein [uncultured Selenomonas sp.]
MKVHHIGYYVKQMEAARAAFQKLGYEELEGVVQDDDRSIRICFLKNGTEVVELVEPEERSPFDNKKLRKMGNTPYHICYEAEDLERAIIAMQDDGYFLVQPPAPAVAIGGRRVAFLYHDDVGLLELVEVEHGDK